MNYNDEQLNNDGGFLKMAEEYIKKFDNNNQTDKQIFATDQQIEDVFKQTLLLLSQNEQWLVYLNNYLNRNSRYKVTAQQIKLEDAIETTRKHKQILQNLKPNILSENTPLPHNKNVKAAIFNCCNNHGSIIENLLWFLLLKNLLTPDSKTLQVMAYEEAQILKRMFELF